MSDVTHSSADALRLHVERIHGGRARYVEKVAVREEQAGRVAWEGEVDIFALEGHPKVRLCYAWREPAAREGSAGKMYTVLETPSVRSATDAVRASIAARHKGLA